MSTTALGIFGSVSMLLYLLHYSTFTAEQGKRAELPSQWTECGLSFGRRHSSLSDRIIRGRESLPNQYPWLVSLRLKRRLQFHICGGSLIYEDVVITAAHCVASFKPDSLAIVVRKLLFCFKISRNFHFESLANHHQTLFVHICSYEII